jgi:hypothetical protein
MGCVYVPTYVVRPVSSASQNSLLVVESPGDSLNPSAVRCRPRQRRVVGFQAAPNRPGLSHYAPSVGMTLII